MTRTVVTVEVDEDVVSLVGPYLANVRAGIDEARASVDRGELEPIRKLAHNLQGTGGSFGFTTISNIGRDLRAAAIAHNATAIRLLLRELADYVAVVVVVPRPVP